MKLNSMNWLVEEYDDHVKELVDEIRRQGHNCDFINYYKMMKDPNYLGVGLPKSSGNFNPEECVLFYGSIQLAGWLSRNKQWVPGVWYNYDKYKVSHWSAKLGKYMLSDNYALLPKGEITRRGINLFEKHNTHDIFIRPDNGTKAFGGKVFQRNTWEKDWDMSTHLMDDHELCMVSLPHGISREWRFIVGDNQIITGSQYKKNGSAEIEAGYPFGAYELCQHILDERYDPDPMYTIDIGQSGDEYYLIEINNFCCSGLYACDLQKIVAKASELAIKEHSEYYNTATLPGC